MRLWIIGNGFDLYHGLKTRYLDYKAFLCRNSDTCVSKHCQKPMDECPFEVCRKCCISESLGNACPVRKFKALPRKKELSNEELWCDLEEACTIDFGKLLKEVKGWYKTGLPAVSGLLHGMLDFAPIFTAESFEKWFTHVQKTKRIDKHLLEISENDLFITFNYTPTLEESYNVKKDRILYIHGSLECLRKEVKASKDDDEKGVRKQERLLFGSPYVTEKALDTALDEFAKAESINAEDKKELRSVCLSLIKYLKKDVLSQLKKDLMGFVNDNRVDLLESAKEVVVAGHSLNRIDGPYLEYLAREFVCKRWCFLFRDDGDIKRALDFCRKYMLDGCCVPWGWMERSHPEMAAGIQCPGFSISWPNK